MDPTRWGPKLWFFMHTLSFNYPENPTQNDKINIKNFFENLKYLIPCETCRIHYNEHTNKLPIDNYLDSKQNLIIWVTNLHNAVNESIGKPIWSLEQVIEHYSNIFSGKCNINEGKCNKTQKNTSNNSLKNYSIIIIIILLSILLLIIYLIKSQKLKCI